MYIQYSLRNPNPLQSEPSVIQSIGWRVRLTDQCTRWSVKTDTKKPINYNIWCGVIRISQSVIWLGVAWHQLRFHLSEKFFRPISHDFNCSDYREYAVYLWYFNCYCKMFIFVIILFLLNIQIRRTGPWSPRNIYPYLALPETYHISQLKSYGGYIKFTVIPHESRSRPTPSGYSPLPEIIIKVCYQLILLQIILSDKLDSSKF